MPTARSRALAALAAIRAAQRPDVFIALRPDAAVLRDADRVDERVAAGEDLPLAGTTVAVKDNIDVAGLPTTAACPAYAYDPPHDAPAIARLRDAGAIVIGKANLDQFATGLVGTRSPYGIVTDARRPDLVAGGSSSGSAVAVALGMTEVAIGTDTAGSGRVPAAFQGIVGVKPTRGLGPVTGVVPACRTLDCVSVFATDLATATLTASIMAGPSNGDPCSRAWPSDAPLAAPPSPRVAIPRPGVLAVLTPEGHRQFDRVVQRLVRAGATAVEVDVEPLLEAGRLLYEGAFVALRYAAVGRFAAAHPDDVDPTVGAIIGRGGEIPAVDLVADQERLARLAADARRALAGTDALLLPTAPRQPSVRDVQADPIGVNRDVGRFTTHANLLDLAAVAVPAGVADDRCFGVQVLAPAFHDAVAADIAALVAGADRLPGSFAPPGRSLLVVGAHRRGQPLEHELTSRGARFDAVCRTAPEYRLHHLATEPPKPGLERVGEGGVSIEGERWRLPAQALADLLGSLPPPMTLGPVRLDDGRTVTGFLCEPIALVGADDITHHASWVEFLAGAGDRT